MLYLKTSSLARESQVVKPLTAYIVNVNAKKINTIFKKFLWGKRKRH
jgi:hypothetical protein